MSQLALNITPPQLLLAEGIKFSITEDAVTLKGQALQAAQKITTIGTPKEIEDANPVLRLIKECLKFMEDSRKAVKAPITKLGKDIEGVAQGFSIDLEQEEQRLKKLVADFMVKQQAIAIKSIRETGEPSIQVSAGEGISTVDEWKFEIEDEAKAYKASPGLFELVPKKNAIIAAGKAGLKMPHIKVWKETGVRVTA